MICPHCGNEVYQPIAAFNPLPNVNSCAPSAIPCIPVINPTVAQPYPQVQVARDMTLCSAAYTPQVTFSIELKP